MNIQELQKQIFNVILLIINYIKDLFIKTKKEVKEEVVDEVLDTKNYNESFEPPTNNDHQLLIEELAEEVIERITEKYTLLKKQN